MKSEANKTHVFDTVQLQKPLFFAEDYGENVWRVFSEIFGCLTQKLAKRKDQTWESIWKTRVIYTGFFKKTIEGLGEGSHVWFIFCKWLQNHQQKTQFFLFDPSILSVAIHVVDVKQPAKHGVVSMFQVSLNGWDFFWHWNLRFGGATGVYDSIYIYIQIYSIFNNYVSYI